MYKKLFLPQRYFYNNENEINLINEGKGAIEVIISRALCHYKLFTLSDIPLARRQVVIQLQIKQWSPFNNYGFHICWHQHIAMVWIWEKNTLEKTLEINGLQNKNISFYPETVLYSRPNEEGIQSLKCINGIEAQVWKNKVLISSRWWASSPNTSVWYKYLRVQRIQNTNPINILSFDFEKKAWGHNKIALLLALLGQEMMWGILIISILLSIITWKVIYIKKWQQATESAIKEVETLTPKVQPILVARNEVLMGQEKIQHLQSLNTYPLQLDIMKEVTIKLIKKNIRLTSWAYHTNQLNFSFKANDLDPRFYVNKLQEINFFTDVEVSINKKQVDVSTKLK